MAYRPYIPTLEDLLGPIVGGYEERANQSGNDYRDTLNRRGILQQILQGLGGFLGGGRGGGGGTQGGGGGGGGGGYNMQSQGGGFFQDLARRQMPGSLGSQLMYGPMDQARGMAPLLGEGTSAPTPGKMYQMESNRGASFGRLPQQNGNNQYQKPMQWGNPMLGYYQPPNWAGWNNQDPGLASNPYNPNGQNYGTGGMTDFLFGRPKR